MTMNMSRFPVVLCFLLTFLKLTRSHAPFPRPRCPQPPVQENFDLTRFLGRWFELYTYFNGSSTYKCSTVDYEASNRTLSGNGTLQTLTPSDDDNYVKTVNEIGTFSESEPAKIIIQNRKYLVYYWILETDYTNYALLWKCGSSFWKRSYTESAWILGRRNTISQDMLENILQNVTKYGLQPEIFTKSIQDDTCAYPTCL